MKQESTISTNFNNIYKKYKKSIEEKLSCFIDSNEPASVYNPIRYVLTSGGKRFRAILVLLSCEAVGGKFQNALNAASAVEILHNFTLVHDDVMDHAVLRRGKLTVHKKWDENVAILAGDEMIAQAYRTLLKTISPQLKKILDAYTDALVQVCEGQGFDKEFESGQNVKIDDYFYMISKKTGRVIATAAEIGALIGGGTSREITALRKYGECLGRAFQVMDDLLDIIGDPTEFGKIVGGDIKEGKKTYLLLKALEVARGVDLKLLQSITPGNGMTKSQIERVTKIYRKSGALYAAKNEVARSTKQAQRALLPLRSSRAKSMLVWLSDQLLERSS